MSSSLIVVITLEVKIGLWRILAGGYWFAGCLFL